jgi:hypothetical protein
MTPKILTQFFTAAPNENEPAAGPAHAPGGGLQAGLPALSKAAKVVAKASTNALRNASFGAAALREQASALVFGAPPEPPPTGLWGVIDKAMPDAAKAAAQGALNSVTNGAASLRDQASELLFGPPPPPPATGLQAVIEKATALPGAAKAAAQGALDSVANGAASLRDQASELVFGPPPPPPATGLWAVLDKAGHLPGAAKAAAQGALEGVTLGAASLRDQASALVFGATPEPMPGAFPQAPGDNEGRTVMQALGDVSGAARAVAWDAVAGAAHGAAQGAAALGHRAGSLFQGTKDKSQMPGSFPEQRRP